MFYLNLGQVNRLPLLMVEGDLAGSAYAAGFFVLLHKPKS
jgi:hypothetical protein